MQPTLTFADSHIMLGAVLEEQLPKERTKAQSLKLLQHAVPLV
jgi:hypothetical protein